MLRKIITIDEEKCSGCGLCAEACHEGAIAIVNGKAKLMREDYCDGFGDCLPACPMGAISFEEREALPYDEEAVNQAKEKAKEAAKERPFVCPGSQVRKLKEDVLQKEGKTGMDVPSALSGWPIQIKLLPIKTPLFQDASLLIAADCTAYAYGNFHGRFLQGKTLLIGCTKLDEGDYSEKLAAIFAENEIKDITVVKMIVPCCNGMVNAVKRGLEKAGKRIPLQVVTISLDGKEIKTENF